MADLTDAQAAQTVKLIGADSSTVETNPMNVDSGGNAYTVNNNASGASAVNIQDGGNSITVDGVVTVTAARTVSAGNSSTATLGSNAVFTGSYVDALAYTGVSVMIFSDKASAASGLSVQWSTDGTNNDDVDTFTISANAGKQFSFGIMSRYFRVVYTNGSVAQGSFRLQTILHTGYFKPSSQRTADTISPEDDAELVKATITGQAVDGNYYNVQVDTSGRLVTSAITGFGANFTFGDITTSATTRVLVNRTAYTEQTTNAQRSIASASANDTSAGTGARTVTITYYDSTGAGPSTETLTLNGTTGVNTVSTTICYIEKISVITAGSTGSNVGIITLYAAINKGGATIGTIAATDNQTFWCHHYVPTGKTCNITGISCGHNGTTVGSGALFTINSFPIGVTNAVETQASDFVRLYGQTSTFARTYVSPIKVTGPARLQTYVTPETSSSTIYRSAFDFFEP